MAHPNTDPAKGSIMTRDRKHRSADSDLVPRRRTWVSPRLVRMRAGDAENGLSLNNVDGQFSHS
jgi:hypothetical protein